MVGVWSRGWSRIPRIMTVLRHPLFVSAQHECIIDVAFVPTDQNGAADALSRGDRGRFRRLRPGASPHPTPLPPGLTEYLHSPDSAIVALTELTL